MDLFSQKREYRIHAQKDLLSQTLSNYDLWSDSICSNIAQLPEFINSDYIIGYIPIPFEVDILPLIQIASELNKEIFFPALLEDMLVFRSANGIFKNNKFGIPEPTVDSPELDFSPDKKKLYLIPGVAFDESKNRLGRGKGYYDKTLSIIPKDSSIFLGVAYSIQIYESIPYTDKDVKLDLIVSEDELIR